MNIEIKKLIKYLNKKREIDVKEHEVVEKLIYCNCKDCKEINNIDYIESDDAERCVYRRLKVAINLIVLGNYKNIIEILINDEDNIFELYVSKNYLFKMAKDDAKKLFLNNKNIVRLQFIEALKNSDEQLVSTFIKQFDATGYNLHCNCSICMPSDYEDENKKYCHNNTLMNAINCNINKGGINIIKNLLNDKRFSSLCNNKSPLKIAFKNKCVDIIKIFFSCEQSDPFNNNYKLFEMVCDDDYYDGIELLIKHKKFIDYPLERKFESIISAGKTEIVKILLANLPDEYITTVNINRKNRKTVYFLSAACEFGKKDIVELLLKDPRISPFENSNAPMRNALIHENGEIVSLLRKYYDVKYPLKN